MEPYIPKISEFSETSKISRTVDSKMASIIFAAAKAVISYLTPVGRNVPIGEAEEVCFIHFIPDLQTNLICQSLTPNSSANRMSPSTQSFANTKQAEEDDMLYIPWPAPSSRVRVIMPDSMLSRDNFVVSHDEILHDVPLTFCDRKLPSPHQVRAASSLLPLGKPHVVLFPALNVVVKFGRSPGPDSHTAAAAYTSLSEAQTLHSIHHFLGKRVPVPKVYAFIHDGDDIFLYMELVQGVTLLKCWADLSDEAKIDVCTQLKPMMQALRELEQDPSDSFIGNYVLHI